MSIFASMEPVVRMLNADAKGREAVRIVSTMMGQHAKPLPQGNLLENPVIILEGADGTGKSTLAESLAQHFKDTGRHVSHLKSPPEMLASLRPHFDAQPKQMRRAFYLLGNYACALAMRESAARGPVIVDRFWPSTVAYALAHDFQVMPREKPELLRMPGDLFKLLPSAHSLTFLLLELPEAERAVRVRVRAGTPVTREEEELEASRAHRERLHAAYRALSVAGEPLTVCDASGEAKAVLQRALEIIHGEMQEKARLAPVSVDWHYTRECFHTAKTSFFLPQTPEGMNEAKECLWNLLKAGMVKLNFSGGEPFLHPKELGELCRFCKEELQLESVSIVSDGSKIQRDWLQTFGRHVDILAISCDSFNEGTNIEIGRGTGMHLSRLEQVKVWCDECHIPFTLNSVINSCNVEEDMAAAITRLNPVRWKVFQRLLLDGESSGGEGSLRDARAIAITGAQFERFLKRHEALECMVPESNAAMANSYLILDEYLRFLNCTGGAKAPSRSLRDVSVMCALREAGFDADMFRARGGIYKWSRAQLSPPADIEELACSPPGRTHDKHQCCGVEGLASRNRRTLITVALVCAVAIAVMQCKTTRRYA